MKIKENKKLTNIYILVKVESGIPVQVRLFENHSEAKKKETIIREKINPEKDETAIFKLKM